MNQPPEEPLPFPDGKTARAVYNPNLADALDEGLRDYWQKPHQVLDSLGSLEGLKVADIGCGQGYFTFPLLDRVGEQGKVFATDIQAEVLETLGKNIPDHLKDRIQLIQATSDTPGIPEPVDLILLVQVFGEIDNPDQFLDSLKPIMHADTRLVIIDSKHITDKRSGFTRPLNLHQLLERLKAKGLVPDPSTSQGSFDFLPKQFFFVLRQQG